jgi:hypothetical protein
VTLSGLGARIVAADYRGLLRPNAGLADPSAKLFVETARSVAAEAHVVPLFDQRVEVTVD